MTEDAVATALRAHGLRVTGNRLAVMAAVAEHPHASADTVAASVRDRLGSVSLQAVYDALRVLTEVGLLRPIQPAGSVVRYETRVADNHHHLACRSCGEVTDVDCAVGYTPCLTASDDAGYLIDEAEVVYWGVCPRCAASSGTSPAPAQP